MCGVIISRRSDVPRHLDIHEHEKRFVFLIDSTSFTDSWGQVSLRLAWLRLWCKSKEKLGNSHEQAVCPLHRLLKMYSDWFFKVLGRDHINVTTATGHSETPDPRHVIWRESMVIFRWRRNRVIAFLSRWRIVLSRRPNTNLPTSGLMRLPPSLQTHHCLAIQAAHHHWPRRHSLLPIRLTSLS